MTKEVLSMINKGIDQLNKKEDISYDTMYEIYTDVLDGQVSDQDLREFIVALSTKGETEDEITAIAKVLIDNAKDVPNFTGSAIDNCGTGGDRSKSFNISTTSAFVLASLGLTVAKHGNKSVTSKTGSSDVLTSLGIDLNFDRDKVAEELNQSNISFLSAQHVHPKMGQIMRVRASIPHPTVFNFIGPCINPVKLDYQFLGVYDREKLNTLAGVLKRLGRKKAIVINGAGFMDEASLLGDNHLVLLQNGELKDIILKPTDYGLSLCQKEDLEGGDSQENKDILFKVLKNQATLAQKETVMLNVGLSLLVAEKVTSLNDGIKLAKEALESGLAYRKFQEVINNHKEYVG